MNVIFLTMSRIMDITNRGIYPDLLRKFRDEGHSVYIVAPRERSLGMPTQMTSKDGVKLLGVKTLNLQKTSIIEKGIGQVLVESQYKKAIKRHLGDVKFDLVLYSTPPITFPKVIKFLRDQNPEAKTYLLLKDIFPQNAVDIGMFGEKSVFNWYFRCKEKALYKVSDYIGCMSPANVVFVLKHNPEVDASKVEVAPNSIELNEKQYEDGQEKAERYYIRKKYDLPTDKPIFIYGGNLGKPQGIDYLIKCLEANKNRQDCYFVVVGSGTDYKLISDWYGKNKNKNG